VRWLALLVAATAWGQTVVRQGDAIRVRTPGPAVAARMDGRTVRLFVQPEGGRLGLMPVPVLKAPGSYALDLVASDGKVLSSGTVTVRNAHFPTQNVVLEKATAGLKPSPGEMETVDAFLATVSETRHWQEPLGVPVPGCITSPFGVKRLRNGQPTGQTHGGLDQRTPAGMPVRAVADGVVKLVRLYNIHGGTVGIDHGQGLESMYLHLSRFAVAEGAAVRKGDVIGYSGSTGRSNAPHLHWSLYANGVPVNPLQWVALKPCPAVSDRVSH
jgi:murein DD-endopeptidase MepM/ murein hydrolase activator NlpD